MRERVCQVAVFLSAVCFIASVVGWTSSYLARGLVVKHLHTTPPGEWRRPDWWCVGTIDGRVVGIRMVAQWQTNRGNECQSMADAMLRDAWRLVETNPSGLVDLLKKNGEERWGFGLARMPVPKKSVDQSLIMFPWWTLCSFTAIWPLQRLYVGARRRARLAAGLCGPCGYDLRYSHGRCPECGAPIAAARLPVTPPTDKPAHARVLAHFAGGLLLAGCFAVSLASAMLWTVSYFTSDPAEAVSVAGSYKYWCYGFSEGRVFYFRCVVPPMGGGGKWINRLPKSAHEAARTMDTLCDKGRPLPGIHWCIRDARAENSVGELRVRGDVDWNTDSPPVITAATVHFGWGLVPGAVGAMILGRRWRRWRATGRAR